MRELPFVSVVIPCLNRAHFLVPTIESVLQQDDPHIECIVVDGGSNDGTIEILKSYGDRIKWVSEPDNGHADAINKGWKMSRGEILAWLNADDVWVVPNAVSQAVGYLQEHPEVDVVYGDCGSIDADGNVVGMSYLHEWDLEYAVEYCDHCIPQPAAFMRRSIVEKVSWLDVDLISKKDHELWLRIGLAGIIHHIPLLLAHARSTPGYMAERGDITADACVKLTQKFFSLPGVPEKLRQRKERALSNAYLKGIDYAWADGRHWETIKDYTSKAILSDPSNAAQALEKFERYAHQYRLTMQKECPPVHIEEGAKILIFGAGEAGRQCLDWIKERKTAVIGFIDNNKDKQGSKLEGIPVFGPERLKKKDFDKIIIASSYWFEIKDQLEKMGFMEGENFGLLSKPTMNLAGDRDIEWSWVASQMPAGSGKALDFGNGGSYLGLIAAQRGFEVTAIDLASVQWPYIHPQLSFIKGDILKLPFPEEHFDLVINCSTVEHVGLVGRYDVKENQPEGDLEAMAHLGKLMKPGGVMLLTIPVGQDAVFTPLARVYGARRLTRLLDGYTVDKEEFWIKDRGNRWVHSDKESALNFKASMGSWDPLQNVCALGCFVLRRP
ncbi:glycosyltransferase [Patescibacteria group bacterium]|nr:glycosyltransferase [Patescibacteria group bacterium]